MSKVGECAEEASSRAERVKSAKVNSVPEKIYLSENDETDESSSDEGKLFNFSL